jgi:glycine reductase complex component B subunit gamma
MLIAALPPIVRQGGGPRAVAPRVPMGANVGEPHNKAMQTAIVRDALHYLVSIDTPGTIVSLPYEYRARV